MTMKTKPRTFKKERTREEINLYYIHKEFAKYLFSYRLNETFKTIKVKNPEASLEELETIMLDHTMYLLTSLDLQREFQRFVQDNIERLSQTYQMDNLKETSKNYYVSYYETMKFIEPEIRYIVYFQE